MRIGSFSFGVITVDGVEYRKDLKIYPDGIVPSWWRAEGHLLQPGDMTELQTEYLDHLIVGQGVHGMMKVSDAVRQFFDELGIEWSAYSTAQAVDEYNRRSECGEVVGAVLHLTC